jgi:hypothetical protein
MSEQDDLTDKDPFAQDEEEEEVIENLITDPMVKKTTFLIHKLASKKKQDYSDIQKKCKKLFAYTNLAKVTLEEGHKIINKLIELTGGEEAKPQQGAKVTDDGSKPKETIEPPKKEEEETKTEEDLVTATMRASVRAAVDITLKEIVAKEVPVQGLGGVVLEISKVIFEAKMSEEASE